MKVLVTIQGPVSSRKSPFARLIENAIKATRKDLTCTVFDHELFSFDEHFELAHAKVLQDFANSPHNVGVVVIGTGIGKAPLTITIDPAVYGSSVILNAIENYLAKEPV